LDVYGGREEKMAYNLYDVKDFLRNNIKKECDTYWGVKNGEWINVVTNNWFDDQSNYDGRWKIIGDRVPRVGKILDMAAGCGTFVLYGLHNGYDVWGVEPEEWKREYYKKKIVASNYPRNYLYHICAGVGESLPYIDETFDLITTYQTLEHVCNVNKCILEMLRVLKPGGILYITAPDYNSFYEPHYRIPFLPKMNKKFASIYLNLIRRPITGLETLNLITEQDIINNIIASKNEVHMERQEKYHSERRKEKIEILLPEFLRNRYLICFLKSVLELGFRIISWIKMGRGENNIDLWVTKRA
jgi:ubiquinone/menaquinone biosynthesis C-methylase UbiE